MVKNSLKLFITLHYIVNPPATTDLPWDYMLTQLSNTIKFALK